MKGSHSGSGGSGEKKGYRNTISMPMKRVKWKKWKTLSYLGLLLFVGMEVSSLILPGFFSSQALAYPPRFNSAPSVSNFQTSSHDESSYSQGLISKGLMVPDDLRGVVESALNDSNKNKGLQYPPLPREMLRHVKKKKVEKAVLFGGSLGVTKKWLGAGVSTADKETFEYSNERTFMIIASNRSVRPINGGPGDLLDSSSDGIPHFITTVRDGVLYPNGNGDAVLGMCIFEQGFLHDSEKSGSLQMSLNLGVFSFSVGTSVKQTDNGTTAITQHSDLFQVNDRLSMDYYRDVYCQEVYSRFFKKMVEKDFSNVILQYRAARGMGSEDGVCRLPSDSNQPRDPSGDPSCQSWFEAHGGILPFRTRDLFIPRCELQPRKAGNRCVLKGGPGAFCHLYMDKRTNKLYPVDKIDGIPRNQLTLVTGGPDGYGAGNPARPCDEASGLICTLQDSSGWLLGSKVGRCREKDESSNEGAQSLF